MSVIVRVVGVVVAALVLLIAASGLSTATTDPLIGKTYKEASGKVAGWGGTSVIETVIGSRLQSDDCIVSTWQKSSFIDIAGTKRNGEFRFNLNCNETVAAPGRPGNSVASPEGKTAKENIQTAAWCSKPAQANYAGCAGWCTNHEGMCTANFS
ncbi:hypothetical protein BH09ACT8_BH09ACT8_45550 [soil metagenome]